MSALKWEGPGRAYLLVGSKKGPLARAELQGASDVSRLQFRITEGSADDVEGAELIQAVPMDNKLPMRMGKVVLRRGNAVVLEATKGMAADARKNLRMPVSFESFVYFQGGGRASIRALNLSCGGIAFYCAASMDVGQVVEVVIPITTEEPSIIQAELLRVQPGQGEERLYACKFLDLIPEEEARLREAVFHVQTRRGRDIFTKTS